MHMTAFNDSGLSQKKTKISNTSTTTMLYSHS